MAAAEILCADRSRKSAAPSRSTNKVRDRVTFDVAVSIGSIPTSERSPSQSARWQTHSAKKTKYRTHLDGQGKPNLISHGWISDTSLYSVAIA